MPKNPDINKEYLDRSWSEMKSILDREMPEKTNRIGIWIFGVLLILVMASLSLFSSRNTDRQSIAGNVSENKQLPNHYKESKEEREHLNKNLSKLILDATSSPDMKVKNKIPVNNSTGYRNEIMNESSGELFDQKISDTKAKYYKNEKSKSLFFDFTVAVDNISQPKKSLEKNHSDKEADNHPKESNNLEIKLPLLRILPFIPLHSDSIQLLNNEEPIVIAQPKKSNALILLSTRIFPEGIPNGELSYLHRMKTIGKFSIYGGLGLGYDNYHLVNSGNHNLSNVFRQNTSQNSFSLAVTYPENEVSEWFVSPKLILDFDMNRKFSLFTGLTYQRNFVFTNWARSESDYSQVGSPLSQDDIMVATEQQKKSIAIIEEENRNTFLWGVGVSFSITPRWSIGNSFLWQFDNYYRSAKSDSRGSVDINQLDFEKSRRFDTQLFLRYRL